MRDSATTTEFKSHQLGLPTPQALFHGVDDCKHFQSIILAVFFRLMTAHSVGLLPLPFSGHVASSALPDVKLLSISDRPEQLHSSSPRFVFL